MDDSWWGRAGGRHTYRNFISKLPARMETPHLPAYVQKRRKRRAMCKIRKHVGIAITCAAFCSSTFAADPPVTILNIELANETIYVGDVSDYSKLASDPNPVPPAQPSNRNFGTTIVIADIVSVNGKPATGTMIEHTRAIR